MRPGQVRPGIHNQINVKGLVNLRFNEAGAGSPRNTEHIGLISCVALTASMRPGQVRPGIQARGARGAAIRRRASMRPGQVRPGILRRAFLEALLRQPGFNEAGAGSPRNTVPASGVFVQVARVASMRPGQVRPGIPGLGELDDTRRRLLQ